MTREERIQEFHGRFDDQWDYTHQQLYWWNGGLYSMFKNDNEELVIEKDCPVHLKDVPVNEYDNYFKFLKEQLALFWGTSVEIVETKYTLDDAIEDYLAGFDD